MCMYFDTVHEVGSRAFGVVLYSGILSANMCTMRINYACLCRLTCATTHKSRITPTGAHQHSIAVYARTRRHSGLICVRVTMDQRLCVVKLSGDPRFKKLDRWAAGTSLPPELIFPLSSDRGKMGSGVRGKMYPPEPCLPRQFDNF